MTKDTDAMVAKIVAQEPLNLQKAKQLAVDFGMPDKYRSVVSKAISLGLAYETKQPARKNGEAIAKKSETVEVIAGLIHLPAHHLAGLEKATRASLEKLRDQLMEEIS